ncbi:unnamed protein product [Pleuronectes platessa]|uniref:Uncharacterized protein n=1 Tax=Pleuronectes platessa TaxID=8262 RepID=A0A9N7Z7I6_PLEPL|nr:unnamed protein product [Pleuronectes platessa]
MVLHGVGQFRRQVTVKIWTKGPDDAQNRATLLADPEEQCSIAFAGGGGNKKKNCAHAVYLFIPSTIHPAHIDPSLNLTVWHTHRTRWPVEKSGAMDPSGVRIRSLSEAAAPQPHLTCLLPVPAARRRSITGLPCASKNAQSTTKQQHQSRRPTYRESIHLAQ